MMGKRLLLSLLSAGLLLEAQSNHITPFTGTWKLNVSKSKFNPGPPFRSFTLRFTTDGRRDLDLIAASGQPLKASLPWSDGKEVSVQGFDNTTATSKIEDRTFHDIWTQNGKVVEDVQGAVSLDGRTLRISADGTDAQGHAYHNNLVFDKTEPH